MTRGGPGAAVDAGTLLRFARHITGRHDVDDMLAEALRCLRPLVAFDGASIQLLDDDGWIRVAASDPVAPAHVKARRAPLGSSLAGRVILTEQPLYLGDAAGHDVPGRAPSAEVGSYFGVPLVADGRAIGLLDVAAAAADAWTDADRAVLAGIAPIVAAAIQNARSHARAERVAGRVGALEIRLQEARAAAAAAGTAFARGDRLELDRQLGRLEAVLAGPPDSTPTRVGGAALPRQRVLLPEPSVRA